MIGPAAKILRNTAFNTAGRTLAALGNLVLFPYLVARLGAEAYGVWTVVGALGGYFGLVDLGFGAAYVKYVSEFEAKGQLDRISAVLNTSFAFYSVVALVVWAAVDLFIDPLVGVFVPKPELAEDARFMVRVTVAILLAANATAAFGAIQQGLQRLDVWNKVGMSMQLVSLAGAVFVIESGYGLRGLVLNNALVFVLTLALRIYTTYRLAPWLRFRPWRADLDTLKRFFGFGIKLQVEKLAVLIIFQTDKLLVAWLLSLEYVTFYDLATRITGILRSLPGLMTSAIFPAVSELNARGDTPYLRRLYLRSVKYLALAVMPIAALTIVCAPHLVGAYMGAGFGAAVPIVLILTAGYLSNVFSYPCTVFGGGLGRPEWQMYAALVGMILNLPCSIGFFYLLGGPEGGYAGGIALGTVVSLVAANLILIAKSTAYLDISPREYWIGAISKPAAAGLVAAGLAFAGLTLVPASRIADSRIEHAVFLGAGAGAIALVYATGIYISRCIDREDLKLAARLPVLRRWVPS